MLLSSYAKYFCLREDRPDVIAFVFLVHHEIYYNLCAHSGYLIQLFND